jgi:hypothetical protein
LKPESVDIIIDRALTVFNSNTKKLEGCLAHNTAILLGRLAFKYPKIMSNYLQHSLKSICQTLRSSPDSKDKQITFSGLCSAIVFNPSQAVDSLIFFFDAVVNYHDAPDSLYSVFKSILFCFKRYLGENWNGVYSAFPEKLKLLLQARFDMFN